MHFDWTISVGNIITAAALFLGFYHAHSQNIRRLTGIETRLNMLYKWFENRVINRGTQDE